jgi:Peptidase C13 family
MNLIQFLSNFAQAASFATAIVLLVLQVRAFRRHSHVSFALLSASTIAALLYFVVWQIVALLAYKTVTTPPWLYLIATAFFLLQIIFGTWGTISLFKSYRQLSEKLRATAEGAIPTLLAYGAPNTATPEVASLLSTPLRACKPTFFERLNDVSRLWLLKSSRNTSSMAAESWILAMALLTLGFWIWLDWLRAGPDPKFTNWSVPVLGCYALLALGAAFIASRASRPQIPFHNALYVTVAVVPFFIAVWWLINNQQLREFPSLEIPLGIYALVYVVLNLRRLTGAWQLRATALLLVIFGSFYWVDQHAYWSASVWYSAPPDSEDYKAHQAESLLFDQRSKIDEVVGRFDDSPSEAPKVFFVGFAGVASQRVFAEEIKLGANKVADRFNVKDRRLLLLNDRRDLKTFPLATVTSLTYALKIIGQKMNPERDILFLALSSHGSADPELSVTNGSLDLQGLTGENLSAALKASDIKRRIIIISACHAGAFIPPLKDPNTIIITAAAADKTSFGCSDDRDLTYFGEAFYRDALPKARTLQDAFTQAKDSIALRETREDQKPSNPQAYFGTELERVLAEDPMMPLSAP